MKPICLINQDEVLKQLEIEQDKIMETMNQKKQFIVKQMENFERELEKEHDLFWEKVEVHLKEQKLLAAGFEESEKLHLHLKDGVIFLCEERHRDPVDIFKKIFGNF